MAHNNIHLHNIININIQGLRDQTIKYNMCYERRYAYYGLGKYNE